MRQVIRSERSAAPIARTVTETRKGRIRTLPIREKGPPRSRESALMTTLIKAALMVVIAGGALAVFNDPSILDTLLADDASSGLAEGRQAPPSTLDPQPGLAQFRRIPVAVGDGPESEAEHIRRRYGNVDPLSSDANPARPGDRLDAQLPELKRARDAAYGSLQEALRSGYPFEIEAAQQRYAEAETRFQGLRRRLIENR